ncbi:FAD-binding oxidoreductase [Candidatus Gottesmanbacteria bacterium]|nr:FAD-binding oxidoreductase [Candidatus Gottesmanbacteria bacterium]
MGKKNFPIRALIKRIGERKISFDKTVLRQHFRDRSFHKEHVPDAVVFPKDLNDVVNIILFAKEWKIPVTPWGGGSGLEGNSIPIRGGISLDMTRMNKIIHVYQKDFQVRVQPGISGEVLNRKLEKYNVCVPAFPGSADIATVGGMVATNAGGMYTLQYGVVGDWVLELTVVDGNGKVIKVGSRSFKSVAGYDLKHLFIGSEGTLGVICEIVFRVGHIPDGKRTGIISSSSERKLFELADTILAKLSPAALEFLDEEYGRLINTVQGRKVFPGPSLIVEFHGSKLESEEKNLVQLCKKVGALYHPWKNRNSQSIWQVRKSVRMSLQESFPQKGIMLGDVGMPRSFIPVFIKKMKAIGKKMGVKTAIFGHLGDGNFHAWSFYDLGNEKSFDRAKRCNEKLVSFVIANGGTCTAEHGVGIGKREFLKLEHGDTMDEFHKVKKLFDPMGILNPGKVI